MKLEDLKIGETAYAGLSSLAQDDSGQDVLNARAECVKENKGGVYRIKVTMGRNCASIELPINWYSIVNACVFSKKIKVKGVTTR